MPPKHYVIVIHDFGMSDGLVTIRSSQAANHHLICAAEEKRNRGEANNRQLSHMNDT